MFGQDFDDASPTSERFDADIPHTPSATGPERRDKRKQICRSGLKLGRVIWVTFCLLSDPD